MCIIYFEVDKTNSSLHVQGLSLSIEMPTIYVP